MLELVHHTWPIVVTTISVIRNNASDIIMTVSGVMLMNCVMQEMMGMMGMMEMLTTFAPSSAVRNVQDEANNVQNAPRKNAEKALKMQNVNSKDKNVLNLRLNTRFCCKQISFSSAVMSVRYSERYQEIPDVVKRYSMEFLCIFKSFLHKSFISLPMQT